jgi:hypothetical protein
MPVLQNGDFNVELGSAGFRFVQSEDVLLVWNYVPFGQVALVNPDAGHEIWNRLISVSSLKFTALGDRALEL